MVPDTLTLAQAHRLQLWRSLTDLARAQEDGRLTPDQVRLLEGLAANLQQLAGQLTQLAELGQAYAGLLEQAARTSSDAAPSPPADSAI